MFGDGEDESDWDWEVADADGKHDDEDISEDTDEVVGLLVIGPDDDEVVGVIVIGGVFGFGLVKRRRDDVNTSGDDLDRDLTSLKSIISSSTFLK